MAETDKMRGASFDETDSKEKENAMRSDLNGRSPFADLVGRQVLRVDAEEESVELEYTARPEFTNRLGILSGGMLSAMLDSVTSVAALATLPDGKAAVHTELKVTYRKMARPGRYLGFGRVVGRDEREIRTRGELRDESGEVMAEAEAVLRILKGGVKREEGRGKNEEGRGKNEEGRGKNEEGRGKREEGRGKRESPRSHGEHGEEE